MKNIARLALPLFFISACTSTPDPKMDGPQTPTNTTSIEAKQIAAENEATNVAEIQFAKGQARLSKSHQDKLNILLKKITNPDDVDNIKVITWADNEYPSVHTEKLPKEQMRLAENRAKTISAFLKKKSKDFKIETFNMAERPNAIEEFFSTDDANLKKSLEMLGIPNTYTAVKSPGRASKTIIMVILKRKDS